MKDNAQRPNVQAVSHLFELREYANENVSEVDAHSAERTP